MTLDWTTFLIMQRTPRVKLDSVWPSSTESDNDTITAKLGHMFHSMRQAGCPWSDVDVFGSLNGGEWHHEITYNQSHESEQQHLRPFRGEAAFSTSITENYQA